MKYSQQEIQDKTLRTKRREILDRNKIGHNKEGCYLIEISGQKETVFGKPSDIVKSISSEYQGLNPSEISIKQSTD